MPRSHSYSLTNKGLRRNNNEDCYLDEPERGLWAVADGMGGHEAGEVASAIVVDTLRAKHQQGVPLQTAIAGCHRAVLDAAEHGQGAGGMGSTVVALQSSEGGYQVCWVGDSRAYLWTASAEDNRLQQLTTDHSYVQMLLASGAIAPEDVNHHPERHIITQCIGTAERTSIDVDCVRGLWQQNQWILLCSDGLTDELEDSEIAAILSASDSPQTAAQALLEKALHKGGNDNITLQIVQSPEIEAAATPSSRGLSRLPRLTGIAWLDAGLIGLALLGVLATLAWVLLLSR